MKILNKRIKQISLVLIIVTIFLGACDKKDNKNTIKAYCIQYASEYEVIQKNSDGKFEIRVLAPDFKQVIESMLEENQELNITSKALRKSAKKHPGYEKEYTFYSDSDEMKDIENAFLEKVAHELAIDAIKNIEYKENWSVEE